MATIDRFEELHVWQASRALVKQIYQISTQTLLSKDFALRDQIRRAAISIMANIAEGFERGGDKEFAHFLSIAKGSCGELRSLLVIAADQCYVGKPNAAKLDEECQQVSRMLAALMRYLDKTPRAGRRLGGAPSETNAQT
jgi:four helix bundle protein